MLKNKYTAAVAVAAFVGGVTVGSVSSSGSKETIVVDSNGEIKSMHWEISAADKIKSYLHYYLDRD